MCFEQIPVGGAREQLQISSALKQSSLVFIISEFVWEWITRLKIRGDPCSPEVTKSFSQGQQGVEMLSRNVLEGGKGRLWSSECLHAAVARTLDLY
ncbi:unnamed protein product [Caretta caretta]